MRPSDVLRLLEEAESLHPWFTPTERRMFHEWKARIEAGDYDDDTVERIEDLVTRYR